MTLFNKNKTVVGLFSNAKDMEKALANLQKQGFGGDDEKLQIIDEQHIGQQGPVITPGPGVPAGQAHTTAVPVEVDDLINSAGSEGARIEKSTHDQLTKLGLEDSEATFYARQVARGSSVVVVETDKKRASQAMDTLEQFNARTVMA